MVEVLFLSAAHIRTCEALSVLSLFKVPAVELFEVGSRFRFPSVVEASRNRNREPPRGGRVAG